MRSRIVTAALLILLGGCTTKRTELLVLVDSDLKVPSELSQVVAHVKPDGGNSTDQSFMLTALPLSFGVLPPNGDASKHVEISVDGMDPSGKVVVTRRISTGFIEGQTLLVDMFLARQCEPDQQHCTLDQTCTEHGCTAVAVDPSTLPVVSPGQELHIDAGVSPEDGGRRRNDAGSDGGTNMDKDAAMDAAQDAAHDGGQDAAPDAGDAAHRDATQDAALDAAQDAGVDAAPDASPDAGFPDAEVDAAFPDAEVDTGIVDAAPDTGIMDAAADSGVDAGPPPAVSLDFGSAAQTIDTGACSGMTVIERRDMNGALAVSGITTISLTASPNTLSLFSDASCTQPLGTLQIPDGQSSATFYFSAAGASSYLLTADASGLSSAMQTETISAGQPAILAFITPARTITAGGCSLVLTVQRYDAFNNPTGQGTTMVNLSGSVATTFSGSPVCAGSIGQLTISPGATSSDFYFSGTAAGADIISASSIGLTTAMQSETIGPSTPRQIAFLTPARTPYAEQCTPGVVTVQSQDQYGNVSPVAADTPVALSANVGELHFFSTNACTTPITQVTIPANLTSASFHFADSAPGTPLITAQAGGLGTISQQQTVNPPICADSGWCFGFPMIQGDALHGTWAADTTHFWAVGDGGQILFYDGTLWTRQESGTTSDLFGVWGSSAASVYAVGRGGTILHFNGSAWSPDTSATVSDLYAVWGTSESDIWAVGQNGTMLHHVVSGWGAIAPVTSANLHGIYGFSTVSAFAAGDSGTILELSGGGWNSMTLGTVNYYGVYGFSPTDVWVGGDNGNALHFDGASWSSPYATGLSTVRGFFGPNTGDVWAVGGGGLPSQPDGRMARWNGSTFVVHDPSGGGTIDSVMNAVTGSGSVGFAVGDHNVLAYWDGNFDLWVDLYINPPGNTMNGVYGASTSDLWGFGGSGEVVRYNGTDWWRYTGAVPATVTLNAAWGSSAQDIWFVGNAAAVYHWDGSSLTAVSTGIPMSVSLFGIWGSASNNIYAVGSMGEVAHYDGTVWAPNTVAGGRWRAISGSSASDIWIVGDNGTARHYNGFSWTNANPPGGTPNLRGVLANSITDVWAVGDTGAILHYNGLSWMRLTSITANDLHSISGNASTMYAVGAGGVILTATGGTWSVTTSPTAYVLDNVFTSPLGGTWAAGASEVIIYHP